MAQSPTPELAAAHAPDEHDAAYDEMRPGTCPWSVVDLALQALPALTLLLGGWMAGAGTANTISTLVAMIALREQLLFPLEEVRRTGVEVRKSPAAYTLPPSSAWRWRCG